MSLPPALSRRKLHTRTIVCEGFEREDGLFDIEASIVDAKTFDLVHPMRGHLAAGIPLHDMQLRLTLNKSMTVQDIAVVTNAAPYAACSTVYGTFRKLIGANLNQGWRRAVNDAVGGVESCTHIRELLMPVATVAFQTMVGQNELNELRASSGTENPVKPHFVDRCKGWAADGDAVRTLLPAFYNGPEPGKPGPTDIGAV